MKSWLSMAGGPSLRAFTNVLIAEAQFPPEQWEDNSGPSGRLHGASGKQDSSHYTGPRSGRREGKLCMKNPSKPWTPSAPEHLHRQDLQPFWQKGASRMTFPTPSFTGGRPSQCKSKLLAELLTLLASGMLSLEFQSSFYPPVPCLLQPHASPVAPFRPIYPRVNFASIRPRKDGSLCPSHVQLPE